MERFIVTVQGHTAASDWPGLATHFRQQRKDLENVRDNDILQALTDLSPRTHGVGYGCILSLRVDGEKFKAGAPPELAAFARRWMLECEPAAAKAIPGETASVCRALAGNAEGNQSASCQALHPLRVMIGKCQPTAEHMTPAHAAALKSALCAKKYHTGQQIVAQTLYVLSKAETALSTTDYLLYCYYGGLVSIGCKDYAKASELLLLAVTTPTNVPDAIICAAWKKYLFVHALLTGEIPEPPRHTPYVTTRALKDFATMAQYVRAYCVGNAAAMRSTLESEGVEFREAGVLGLAHQLLEKVATRSIQRLTSTYLTISLADIAKESGMESADKAEMHILKMIDAGEMHASVDEAAGMVRFLELQEDVTPALVATLNEKMGEMVAMQARLQAAAREVGLEPKFLKASMQLDSKSSPAKSRASGGMFSGGGLFTTGSLFGGPGSYSGE